MAKSRRYHPLVSEDLKRGIGHYEAISPDLAIRFRASIHSCFEAIGERPESFACIQNHFRAALLDKFPYVVVFELRKQTIIIYAVYHAASDDGGWFGRKL